MKELENKVAIEKHEVENDQKEIKWIGQIKKPHNGMTMFRYKIEDGSIQEAEIVRSVSFDAETSSSKTEAKLQVEKGCLYIYAINKKNALRKIQKEHGKMLNK